MKITKDDYRYSEVAFTLVELLFVVILLSILGVSVMKVITQVQAASQSAATIRSRTETASRVFSELRLQLSSKGEGGLSNLQTSGSANPGYAGSTRKTISYDNAPGDSNNSKILRITTIASRYANSKIPALYGEVEARYYLKKGSPDETKLNTLVMEIWKLPENVQINQNQNPEPVVTKVLAENIKSIDFRFRQQGKWINELNSFYAISPSLVEVTLEVGDPDSDTNQEVFRTALPYGPPKR